MKKFSFKLFFFIFAGVVFYSCTKSDDIIISPVDNSTNFKYPYSLNTNWFFTTTPNYTFHPDSVRNYISLLDTAIETGYAIWKNDTIINGVTARALKSNHTSTSHAFNTVEFYVQTDTGLVNVGYDEDYGPGFGPYRPGASGQFLYQGKYFSSLSDLRHRVFSEISLGDAVPDAIKCISYPIVEGQEWFFRNTSISPLQTQRKKYLNYEQVQTPAGTYNCIKIQRRNYTGSPQVLDTNYISFDYFSKVGMIKRSYKVKNIPFTLSGSVIGYIDIGQEVILNSVNIISR